MRGIAELAHDSCRGYGVILFCAEDIGCPHAMRLGYTAIYRKLSREHAELSRPTQGITIAFHLLSHLAPWLSV